MIEQPAPAPHHRTPLPESLDDTRNTWSSKVGFMVRLHRANDNYRYGFKRIENGVTLNEEKGLLRQRTHTQGNGFCNLDSHRNPITTAKTRLNHRLNKII